MSGLINPIAHATDLNADRRTPAEETSGGFTVTRDAGCSLGIGIEALGLQPGATEPLPAADPPPRRRGP